MWALLHWQVVGPAFYSFIAIVTYIKLKSQFLGRVLHGDRRKGYNARFG
jgi:hypothetical protein